MINKTCPDCGTIDPIKTGHCSGCKYEGIDLTDYPGMTFVEIESTIKNGITADGDGHLDRQGLVDEM